LREHGTRLHFQTMPDLVTTSPMTVTRLRQEAERETLFAILDACDEPLVPERVRAMDDRAVSLYRSPAAEDLSAIAPYLVRVDADTLDWIGATLWNRPWGVFVLSAGDLETLRTHFRKYLLVDGPDGDKWYFRFYDPRVMASFLPAADATQLTDFFGPVTAFAWTDADDYGVTLAVRAMLDPAPASRPRITLRR
jgi:hypothetical protein